MRAVVLVGGEGTRLRPLTRRTLKQLVPILNRPLLEHLLLHLRAHGVTDVTLAMTRHSQRVEDVFGDGSALGMRLEYVYEETPLGSGGAIACAAAGWQEPFLVCNGDLLTDLDVTAFIGAHETRHAELSIALYEVEDPSPFGVVVLDGQERVTRFVEKPPRELAPSRLINAGVWLFKPALLAEMDGSRFNRVEDELFPTLANDSRGMYGFVHRGFWLDVGNPDAYLSANISALEGVTASLRPADWPADDIATQNVLIGPGAVMHAPVMLGPGSTVAPGALISRSVAGRGCVIGRDARVYGSVLWDDVVIEEGATVSDSVLAAGTRIEAGAIVRGAVLGHGAKIAAGADVPNGTRIEPDAEWSAVPA
jgi:mannose-1-phosphate guanylyltransferase